MDRGICEIEGEWCRVLKVWRWWRQVRLDMLGGVGDGNRGLERLLRKILLGGKKIWRVREVEEESVRYIRRINIAPFDSFFLNLILSLILIRSFLFLFIIKILMTI